VGIVVAESPTKRATGRSHAVSLAIPVGPRHPKALGDLLPALARPEAAAHKTAESAVLATNRLCCYRDEVRGFVVIFDTWHPEPRRMHEAV